MVPARLIAAALAAAAVWPVAGCAAAKPELTGPERQQRERIYAMRLALHATRTAKPGADAEQRVAAACARLLALKTEGEVRRAVTELELHPNFLAQIAVERANRTASRTTDPRKEIVTRPQVFLIGVQQLLMRVEIEALFRQVSKAGVEELEFTEALSLLADPDFRTAAAAGPRLPPHYRATQAMSDFARARADDRLDAMTLQPGVRELARNALPLLFPPPITSTAGGYAAQHLEHFLGGNTAHRTAEATGLIDALRTPELPQHERLQLLRRMLRNGDSVDELLTVFGARAQGAGFVMRRLALSPDRDVRAAAILALPPGSRVIPAAALVGGEGVALAALQPQLDDPSVTVRAAAALAWEGVPGISLGSYDPRASADDRAAALEALADRIAEARAKAQAAAAGTSTPAGAGSSSDPLNPFAKPKTDTTEPPSREQRKLMRTALRAAGLLLDDFIRQLKRDPVNMVDVYEAYQRTHPWGGCHDAGDGRLKHEPSTYHLDVRKRPDGRGLTVWADPPEGSGGASYWWDKSTSSIKFVRAK